MKKLGIPVVVEPGSQPIDEDGVVLDYMSMPKEVWTYAMPTVPEPEEVEGLDAGVGILETILEKLSAWQPGDAPAVIPLDGLDDDDRAIVDQVLGDGEVSVIYEGAVRAVSQESVLAGVWRVQYLDADDRVERDVIEVAEIPSLVSEAVFGDAKPEVEFDADNIPAGVGNAAPILTELADKLAAGSDEPHVVNLTLLPCTDEDIAFLMTTLGGGPTVILSRGYGNCRITSTAVRNIWWVQYFNSQDTLILNSIEVSRVPAVACAAAEDIADSKARLEEILEVYR
ncbi:MAG: hydrogenase expression/formation C-terminal domain-containing protein [Woeseiaceae bacterium]|jgi:hydrogenase-1 operon protein HyaF|nr:hydrogenase expression/formation C-terminal domain-containing protein [Woeseiaceae bacterium]